MFVTHLRRCCSVILSLSIPALFVCSHASQSRHLVGLQGAYYIRNSTAHDFPHTHALVQSFDKLSDPQLLPASLRTPAHRHCKV